MAKKLTKERLEELARICWENTGHGAPVVQPGEKLVFEATGEEVPEDALNPQWGNVNEWSKDIYRRQAGAVAVALGYEFPDGVDLKRPQIT